MEDILERILSHPLLIVCLSLVCLLLLFSILKGLLKLAFCALVAGGLFLGYLHFFQDQYPLPEVDTAKLNEPTIALLCGISKEKGIEHYQ